MGEKREVDRADEPRTYAKEVPNGACSCNAHLHTLVWLENLCIIEWLNIRLLVTNQGSWPMSHRADPILTDNGSSFKVSEAQSNNVV